MASYFIESQAEASETDSEEFSCISDGEWDECMRQAACGGSSPPAAPVGTPPRALAAAAAPVRADEPGLRSPSRADERVEREHPSLGRLARAAAAASPYALPLSEVPEFPQGLVDLCEDTNKKTTRVVFTINNPGAFRPIFHPGKMAYLVWQLERGEQGTEHVQGYCRFSKQFRLRTVLPLFGGHAHVLLARGSEKQCRDYCTKEDTRIAPGEEHGEYKEDAGKQGKRSDLVHIAEMCISGQTLREIGVAHPGSMIRYGAGITQFHELVAPAPPVERTVSVEVLWGPSGTGKTHRVRMNGGSPIPGGIFVVKPGRGPWDRYQGEKTVLFDEFNWTKWEIFDMNQYLDKWDCPLDCRFRNKSAAWTRVVICANSSPLTWYTTSEMEVQLAFRRRLGHGCRHVLNKFQDVALLPPDPDLSPVDGRDILHLHPRARDPSSHTSAEPLVRAAAAAAAAPYLSDMILCPDSQPRSPTQPASPSAL